MRSRERAKVLPLEAQIPNEPELVRVSGEWRRAVRNCDYCGRDAPKTCDHCGSDTCWDCWGDPHGATDRCKECIAWAKQEEPTLEDYRADIEAAFTELNGDAEEGRDDADRIVNAVFEFGRTDARRVLAEQIRKRARSRTTKGRDVKAALRALADELESSS
jgi:hypothetical protein